jgi:hypothetical protein
VAVEAAVGEEVVVVEVALEELEHLEEEAMSMMKPLLASA